MGKPCGMRRRGCVSPDPKRDRPAFECRREIWREREDEQVRTILINKTKIKALRGPVKLAGSSGTCRVAVEPGRGMIHRDLS